MKKRSPLLHALLLALPVALTPFSLAHAVLPAEVNGRPLPSLAPMLERVLPAVVSVHIKGMKPLTRNLPETFRYFFGPNSGARTTQQPFEGLGSGVIIDAAKGYILTNHHVINNADQIRVQLYDGREYDARLIGSDSQTDIALLQLNEATDLRQIQFADSDQAKTGDFVVAVGYPFGLGQTATSGIISALGRSGLHVEGLENFIQTDASINRGNSGGALVNLNGELIGINTAILAPGGGSIGIGFAIPSNMARNLTQQLIEHGSVQRGLLGIRGSEMNADIAHAFNIETSRGAFVNEVKAGSAAARAGIESGDILTTLNGSPLRSFAALRAKIATTPPGSKVTIGLIRNGKPMTVNVTLDANAALTHAETLLPAFKGATLSNGTSSNGLPGIKVTQVQAKSPASQAGLKAGDVILALNQERIPSLTQLRTALAKKPPVIALNIQRGDTRLYLLIR